MKFSLESLLRLFEPREHILKAGEFRIGNLPRTTCVIDGKPLELIYQRKKGLATPRGIYYCNYCKTVYDFPMR